MRKVRCNYNTSGSFSESLKDERTLEVFTTDKFDPGEQILLEVSFPDLPGKLVVRAIGSEWHAARPRLRVRAGGQVLCTDSEWKKIEFLEKVANGSITLSARRKHVRLPVLAEIEWRRIGHPDSQVAAMSEISEGGALLLTDAVMEVGEEIVVEVTPPGSVRPMEILCIVRNTTNGEGIGVEFVARDMGGVQRLREIIRRLVSR
ncbi:MAG: PilZ domain-containing protein [Nannocystaceae bacterium]